MAWVTGTATCTIRFVVFTVNDGLLFVWPLIVNECLTSKESNS